MKRTVLKNGIVLITKKKPGKSIAIVISIKSGHYSDPPNKLGLAHFLEHMMFKGTKKRTQKQIDEEIIKFGSYLNGETVINQTNYDLEILAKDFDKTLEIMADMIQNPALKKEIIKKERGVILGERRISKDDPEGDNLELFLKMMFKKHPLRNPCEGTIKTIKSIKRKDILDYYKKYYVPNNMAIIIVGNINHTTIKNKVEKAFSKLKPRKLPKQKIFQEFIDKNKEKTIKRKGFSSSYIIIGFQTAGGLHKDHYVLEVIENIFIRGCVGRLMNKLRGERGLSYGLEITNGNDGTIGTFIISADSNKKDINKVKKIILDELKLKNLEEKEINDTKEYIVNCCLLEGEDVYDAAEGIASDEVLGDAKRIERYVKEIKKITKKDILRVIKKYFQNPTILMIVPK